MLPRHIDAAALAESLALLSVSPSRHRSSTPPSRDAVEHNSPAVLLGGDPPRPSDAVLPVLPSMPETIRYPADDADALPHHHPPLDSPEGALPKGPLPRRFRHTSALVQRRWHALLRLLQDEQQQQGQQDGLTSNSTSPHSVRLDDGEPKNECATPQHEAVGTMSVSPPRAQPAAAVPPATRDLSPFALRSATAPSESPFPGSVDCAAVVAAVAPFSEELEQFAIAMRHAELERRAACARRRRSEMLASRIQRLAAMRHFLGDQQQPDDEQEEEEAQGAAAAAHRSCFDDGDTEGSPQRNTAQRGGHRPPSSVAQQQQQQSTKKPGSSTNARRRRPPSSRRIEERLREAAQRRAAMHEAKHAAFVLAEAQRLERRGRVLHRRAEAAQRFAANVVATLAPMAQVSFFDAPHTLSTAYIERVLTNDPRAPCRACRQGSPQAPRCPVSGLLHERTLAAASAAFLHLVREFESTNLRNTAKDEAATDVENVLGDRAARPVAAAATAPPPPLLEGGNSRPQPTAVSVAEARLLPVAFHSGGRGPGGAVIKLSNPAPTSNNTADPSSSHSRTAFSAACVVASLVEVRAAAAALVGTVAAAAGSPKNSNSSCGGIARSSDEFPSPPPPPPAAGSDAPLPSAAAVEALCVTTARFTKAWSAYRSDIMGASSGSSGGQQEGAQPPHNTTPAAVARPNNRQQKATSAPATSLKASGSNSNLALVETLTDGLVQLAKAMAARAADIEARITESSSDGRGGNDGTTALSLVGDEGCQQRSGPEEGSQQRQQRQERLQQRAASRMVQEKRADLTEAILSEMEGMKRQLRAVGGEAALAEAERLMAPFISAASPQLSPCPAPATFTGSDCASRPPSSSLSLRQKIAADKRHHMKAAPLAASSEQHHSDPSVQ